MKKRVKLLTTIASLCLAVALMAFGVYAASNPSVTISSNVSFQVSDVYVNITGVVKQGEDVATASAIAEKGYSAKSYTEGTTMVPVVGDTLAPWAMEDIAFTSANDTIVYELTIENVSADGSDVKVTLSSVLSAVTGTTPEVVSVLNGGSDITDDFEANSPVTVATTKSLVITLARTLDNKTVPISSTTSWSATLTCTR